MTRCRADRENDLFSLQRRIERGRICRHDLIQCRLYRRPGNPFLDQQRRHILAIAPQYPEAIVETDVEGLAAVFGGFQLQNQSVKFGNEFRHRELPLGRIVHRLARLIAQWWDRLHLIILVSRSPP